MPFHLTPAKNLPTIMSQGLVPQRGDLSALSGERVDAIYLMKTLEGASNALENWMEWYLDDDVKMSLLEVEIPPDAELGETPAAYEIVVLTPIPPQFIKVVFADLDNVSF